MEWISVKDSLPKITGYEKTSGDVFVCGYCNYTESIQTSIGWYNGNTWNTAAERIHPLLKIENITHWMPLPKPPKQ